MAVQNPTKDTHEIGAIETTGEHKGEIYGGIYPADNKPIWFSAAPRMMDHYAASAWAEGQGGSLLTRKQGDYLNTIKDQGAFKTIFNQIAALPAGYVWLKERIRSGYPPRTEHAWCQRLSDGAQIPYLAHLHLPLPVLCVRR